MKNKLVVVGLGPGNLDFLTKAAEKAIKSSQIVIGGKRQLFEIDSLIDAQEKYIMKKLQDMKEYVLNNLDKRITFIVSGDTGYYSLLTYLKKSFEDLDFYVIPGISSFQYLFSKLEMIWENYNLCSVHGRENDYINILKNSQNGVVLLTDEKNNPIEIVKNVLENKIKNIEVIIGERLSYPDECITRFNINDYEKNIKNYEMNVTILRKI